MRAVIALTLLTVLGSPAFGQMSNGVYACYNSSRAAMAVSHYEISSTDPRVHFGALRVCQGFMVTFEDDEVENGCAMGLIVSDRIMGNREFLFTKDKKLTVTGTEIITKCVKKATLRKKRKSAKVRK